MDLQQLRQLEEIARQGTMSAAARVLHLSQPALSRSLARLEAELGQPLFDRPGRRLVLNEAGRLALEHARAILREEQAMRAGLAELSQRTRALRVGTVAPAPLWRLTALVVERFPGLLLTSQSLTQEEVRSAVADGVVDLGITSGRWDDPGVDSVLLMEENLAVALPADHVLAQRARVSLAELDGETFLLFAGIGFWRGLCDRGLPHSRFIVQEDRRVFEQLIATSDLPHFITDAPSLTAGPGRAVVPISDSQAHVAFFLGCRRGAGEAAEVLAWVRDRRRRA